MIDERGASCITVHKSELLETLKTNRAKHAAAYEEAFAGFRITYAEKLEEMAEAAENDSVFQQDVNLPVPQNHTRSYDKVIRQLEMCVDDKVKISDPEFSHYVMDDWSWKQETVAMSSMYAGKASRR